MKISYKIGNGDKVVRKIEEYEKSLKSKIKNFLSKLSEIGFQTADIKFRFAQYDGTNDVTVEAPRWDGDKVVIEARGQAVVFIEFGTGVRYNETHPKASELGFTRGTFGQGHGSRETWGYYGEQGTDGQYVRTDPEKGEVYITHGNPPARALYDAVKEMRGNILSVAREAFIHD